MLHYLACDCNVQGSNTTSCDSEGIWTCKTNTTGDKCNKCMPGLFPFPACNNGKNHIQHKSFILRRIFSAWKIYNISTYKEVQFT